MFTEEQMKQYDEQVNKTREKLVLASECFHPFDYGYCLELIKIVINSWKEYYATGINVWGEDKEDSPSRKSIADELFRLYQEYEDCEYGAEDEKLKALFTYFGEHIVYMWD